MPASQAPLRRSLIVTLVILTLASLQVPLHAETSGIPVATSSSGTLSVNLLINYGNGTLEWHNRTLVPDNFNFFNVTLLVTDGDLAALFFPAFQSHFVYRIRGAGCPDANPFCEVFWSLWILNGLCWVSSDVGVDQILVSEGKTVAWLLVPVGEFGQKPPTGENCVNVDIDVKPGSDPNSINVESQGVIPVAILTTAAFDASNVDPSTVKFGRAGTEAASVQSALEDVDGDGDMDMVLQFKLQETGILQGDTQAILMGRTFGGRPFKGSDSIRTLLPGGGSSARSV